MKIDSLARLASPVAMAALLACGGGEKEEKPAAPAPAQPAAAAPAQPAAAQPPAAAAPAQPAAPAEDAYAPPTDDQIKKDIAGNASGIISIELSKEPGKKSWSDAHSQYFWERSATIKRQANIDGAPEAKLIVTGFARYELTAGRYVYREYKVADNQYEGIAKPSDDEALGFIKSHLNDILAGESGAIVNGDKVEVSLVPAEEQKWEWSNAKSVSFKIRVKYDRETSYTEVTSFEVAMTAKIFRDDPKGPWLRAIGMDKESKELGKKTMTAEELRALPHGLPK